MPEYFISRPNKKSRQLLNKKYRLFKTDLWGILAQSSRTNSIVKKIASHTYSDIVSNFKSRAQFIKYVKSSNARLYHYKPFNRYIYQATKRFAYNATDKSGTGAPPHAKKIPAAGGIARINRRKFTLFYGANRCRIPTFQKYVIFKRSSIHNLEYDIYRPNHYFQHKSAFSQVLFPGILETRADIFLFRAGFFETVYQARALCFFGKAVLRTKNSNLAPGTNLMPFELCSVRHYRFVQKRLRFLLKQQHVYYIPRWIHVSYTYMVAFLIDYPTKIGYPCKELTWGNFTLFDHGF